MGYAPAELTRADLRVSPFNAALANRAPRPHIARHALFQPAGVYRPARDGRAAHAGQGPGLARSRNDRDPDAPVGRGRAGGIVRERRPRHRRNVLDAGSGQSIRHRRAGRLGHGPRTRGVARDRPDPGLSEAARAARRLARGVQPVAVAAHRHGNAAAHREFGALPGNRLARQRNRSRRAAGANLLAGRAGAADHLAAGRDQGSGRASRGRLQSRHLPHASDRPRHHPDALAQASRRGAASSALERRAGRAVAGRRGHRRRSGHHPRRGDPGARHPLGIPVRRPLTRPQGRIGRLQDRALKGAGAGRDRARRPCLARRIW